MKKVLFFTLLLTTLIGVAYRTRWTPSMQTTSVVAAANDFLSSLSADQRKMAQFEFLRPKVATATQFNFDNRRGDSGAAKGQGNPPNGRPAGSRDTTQQDGDNDRRQQGAGNDPGGGPPASGEQYGKAVWSNFPVSITPRPGIELGSLTAPQRQAAIHLLQLVLSRQGYQKVQEIMGADQALADAGTDFLAGNDHYLIAIFGTPDPTKPWMLEFGGHHLGLNVVIAGDRGAMTPTLTGTQPAIYTVNGKTVRVLAKESDKAFDLLNALDDNQRKKALLNYSVGDLVLGPGHDGQILVPEGLKVAEMTDQQRRLLVSLIAEWAGIVNESYQQPRLAEIEAGLKETWFAWSGPTTHEPGKNGTAYYRIQGPKVFIEFAPQATFGDKSMHVHTIYRDPTNEYGSAYSTP